MGANDRINIAIIGARGRGRDHVATYAKLPQARIAAVCDIDQAQVERSSQLAQSLQNELPKPYADIRKMLENRDIDAVSIATPNHWHALATIWACQAGKDVYVEKPACHNIFEGRKMVEAARKYNRMVQVGMQSRSNAHKIEAIRLLREGVIGKVYMAKGICYKRRKSIGKARGRPGAARHRLRHLARARPHAPLQPQPLPLQLALVLGDRQRRYRQPGGARNGHCPLGARQGHPARTRGFHGRQVHLRR